MPRSHYNVGTRAETKLLGCKSITSSDSVRTFFSDKNHFERIGNAFLPSKTQNNFSGIDTANALIVAPQGRS